MITDTGTIYPGILSAWFNYSKDIFHHPNDLIIASQWKIAFSDEGTYFDWYKNGIHRELFNLRARIVHEENKDKIFVLQTIINGCTIVIQVGERGVVHND